MPFLIPPQQGTIPEAGIYCAKWGPKQESKGNKFKIIYF
jgi:hypothetical protein